VTHRRLLALTWVLAGIGVFGVPTGAWATARDPTPLYTYYYIWFNPSSWNRAKRDYPLLGRYSSDEASVMRTHVRMARQAGIVGFIVSWKSTPVLDARLDKLVSVSRSAGFRLAIIYQGLDFERRPLPVTRVARDLGLFARRWGRSPTFRGFGRPLVIWSGTWKYTPDEVERVTRGLRDRLTILASERNSADYQGKAPHVDGDAYYWSSVNPDTYSDYPGKLQEMGRAVHAAGGLWFAPSAPGFDARLIGGRTVVDRKDGDTLRRQYEAAQSSNPDAIGLISWNEFSENSHVEPSTVYGATALEVLADIRGAHLEAEDLPDSSEQVGARGAGSGAVPVLTGFVMLVLASGLLLWWRRDRRPGAGRDGRGSRKNRG